MKSEEATRGGVTGLSRPARGLVSAAAAVIAVVVAIHLGMVFLYVAPSNVLSRQYSTTINDYISPEFVQNWKLFAPEPLHVNVAVHARAEIRQPDGSVETTGWINVFADDIDHTRGNLVPSHTRNQLRKGWRAFINTHDENNRARNLTGWLVEEYLKRVVLLRLSTGLRADAVERVQLRSATTPVPEPAWSGRQSSAETTYRVLPWWSVNEHDFPEVR
ncbi:MAG: DUF5819 family protein [Haloechinothrix sp.]